MGACDISFGLPNKASKKEILDAFNSQRSDDSMYNGHREGYSGDFQTVHDVKFHLDKTFNSEHEAMEYCLEHAEKWSHVIAVYYKNTRCTVKPSKRLETLKEKLKNAIDAKNNLEDSILKDIREAKSKTITCKRCTSRVARSYIKNFHCPVCYNVLLSTTQKNRLDKASSKIESIQKQIEDERKKLLDKASKNAPINTLVAGWGAC